MLVPGALNPRLIHSYGPEVIFLGQNWASVSYDIGDPRDDRIVVVAGQREQDASGTPYPMPTINGVAASAVYNAASTDPMCLGYALVPAGNTVNLAGGISRTAAWLLRGVTTLDQSLTASGTTPEIDISATFPAPPCVMIGIARTRSLMAGGVALISGALRDVSTDATSTSSSGNSGWVTGHAYADYGGTGTLTLKSNNNFSSGLAAAGIFK